MKKILCPSMMCADFSNLAREVRMLEEADIDIFHLDVMDGQFVPNFGMGMQDIAYICHATDKLKEVHLMIENPGNYVEKFIALGADIIYFHPESDYHPATTLQKIKETGKQSGIVLSPGTSLESVQELMHMADNIMVMSVNPGQAGQIYLPYVDDKIQRLVKYKQDNNFTFQIAVDGAVTIERIRKLSTIGVNAFVLGTAGLFVDNGKNYKEIVDEIRNDK